MNPVVAITSDPATGSPVAIRFPSAAACYAWEDAHRDITVDSMIPLVSRSEVLARA